MNTYDEATQQNTTKPVTNVFTKGIKKIYDIIVGKDTLHATPEHPFYTNGKWTIAQNLRKGMNLLTLAGMLLPITQINAHDTLATVHNFEVQDAHTYYVGSQQVLVHNLCGEMTKELKKLGFSDEVIDKLKNAARFETKLATEIGDILSKNKAIFDRIPADRVDAFLDELKLLSPKDRAKYLGDADSRQIRKWIATNKAYNKAMEVPRIKKLRAADRNERIKELGIDFDTKRTSFAEGQAGFDLEEQYGYFHRYVADSPTKKGDWISLSGAYEGRTFDELGGELADGAINAMRTVPSQRVAFNESLELHFRKADYVILNLTGMKRLEPIFYQDALDYIASLGPSYRINADGKLKLINITK